MTDEPIESLRDRLHAFGLSGKEIDTYLAVLDGGKAKTADIADRAGVSQGYVYDIAERLESRGLVMVDDYQSPTTVAATPPEEAVDSLVEDLREVQPVLESQYTEPATHRSTFEIIKSRQTAVRRIESMLAEAEEEAFLVLPQSVAESLRDEIAAAADREVMVLLLESTANGSSFTEQEYYANVVRRWDVGPMPFVATVDWETGLVGERALLESTHGDEQAVMLSQMQITGSLLGSFMGSYWPSSTEIHVADPWELPVRRQLFRPAALAATLHHRDESPVYATVDAEPVDDDGPRKWRTGEVVDVRQGLVEPLTNDFPVENTLLVDFGDRTVSVGGRGAFVEDLAAYETAIHADPEPPAELR